MADPAGFTTTATLNGESIPVGTSINHTGAGFYELIVTEVPDGGGAANSQTFLFNIRASGRGSSEKISGLAGSRKRSCEVGDFARPFIKTGEFGGVFG